MKPATPLPWKDGPLFQRESKALFSTDETKPGKWQRRLDFGATGEFAKEDAAYIAHACNAYPELVAAVRDAMHKVPDAQDCRAIQNLLVKIGEIK